ncbi:MAG: carboxypeptidase regulatory-like domain-containing protein [Candidatus Brocadiales bacterium]
MKCSGNGFTLIDVIIILAALGILLGTMIPLTIQLMNKKRETQTIDELDRLRIAVTGNPVITIYEARAQFGYVGDMGNLPTSIEDLYKKGGQSAFSFNTTKKVGAGWDGPYIDPKIVEHIETLKTDAFGNDYDYTTTPFTDSTTGATVEGRIRSKGKDGTSATSDDLSLDFFSSQVKSKVSGVIKTEEGDGVSGATVTMNYPNNGTLVSTSTTTDSAGFYTFDDIPYGNRSVTVEPRLVIEANSALAVGTQDRDVKFTVTNCSNSDINITSYKAVYSSSPQAFYTTLIVGGTTVYNSSSPRLGSGDAATFTAQTVGGGIEGPNTVPIQVQSPATEVGDITIGTLGGGASILIEMNEFMDAQTGSAANVDMTGVSFTVTFNEGLSDESVVSFTTVSL